MPTASNTLGTLLPVGANVADWLQKRRASKNALNTITTGTTTAAAGLDAASIAANKRAEDALASNHGLYDTTTANQKQYQDVGSLSLGKLQGMIDNPDKFDPSSVATDPGYQFGLSEGLKGGDRAAQARGSLGNGGQVKAQTRYALDYATTKYDEAFQRFRQSQSDKKDLYTTGTTIGQNANAAVQSAGNTLGAQTAATAQNVGQNTIGAAEDKAALTLGQSQAAAQNQVNQSDGTSGLIQSAVKAVPALASLFSADPAAGAVAASAYGTPTALGSAGHALVGLATNPVTIGIAGALAAGALWLKSQAHWEANTAVKDFENPFAKQQLAPFASQWDQAVKAGTMTQESGNQALEAYQTNFEEYTRKINEWAGSSKDKKKVAQQSIRNLWDKVIYPQVQRMTGEIASMPAGSVK